MKANIKDRSAKLLEEIPKNKTIKEAMIKAGYSENMANKQPGRTARNAIALMEKRAMTGDIQAEKILQGVGITREQIAERYKYLALESRNEAVSLQALKPLARIALGITDESEAQKPAPALNIGIIADSVDMGTVPDGEGENMAL